MPAGVVGGGGVEDDVHQLADIEHCSHLKVKSGDDRVFVGRRSGTVPQLGLLVVKKTQALITMLVERDCRIIR
jgi:hypothetical protein